MEASPVKVDFRSLSDRCQSVVNDGFRIRRTMERVRQLPRRITFQHFTLSHTVPHLTQENPNRFVAECKSVTNLWPEVVFREPLFQLGISHGLAQALASKPGQREGGYSRLVALMEIESSKTA